MRPMKVKRSISPISPAVLPLILCACALSLCGCAKDLYDIDKETADGKTYDFSVRITVSDELTRGPLDPDEDNGEYTLGFTEDESAINTLTLIMMRVLSDKTEVFESSQTIVISETDKTDGAYKIDFNLTGYSGIKRFYLGANMEQEHIGAFTTPDRIFDTGTGTDGHNIVEKLMTVSPEDGSGSNIVMTADITQNGGSRDIELTGDNPTVTIDNPVKLTRTVAKVLLTCTPDGSNKNYVNAVDSKDKDQSEKTETGWIRFDNVRYILNVLNRKTYLDYRVKSDGDGEWLTDPNYNMSDWIVYRGDETGRYGLKDLDAYRRDFWYYDTQEMVDMLTAENGIQPCTRRTATVYDENKIGDKNSSTHYTEGLYCTENMIYKDMTFSNDPNGELFESANRFVTTHIIVGAKYTPKNIWTVNGNGELTEKTASTEDEATGILDESFTSGEYLSGTFWQCTDAIKGDDGTILYAEGDYFTYSGLARLLQKHPDADLNRYDGGWGYYYSNIDGSDDDNGHLTYDGLERWGVKRNHYYILNVTEVVAPGSPFPGNELMRIHSEVVGWIDQGGSEIDIDIPQESEQ